MMEFNEIKNVIYAAANDPSAARRAVEAAEDFIHAIDEEYARALPPDKAAQDFFKKLLGEYFFENRYDQ